MVCQQCRYLVMRIATDLFVVYVRDEIVLSQAPTVGWSSRYDPLKIHLLTISVDFVFVFSIPQYFVISGISFT